MIICLGESIVAIGLAANGLTLDAELVAAVSFGLLATIGLWRTYFGELAVNAERRLQQTDGDLVLAAADGYSYLHLLIVAGIVVFAVGVRVAIEHPGDPLPDAVRLCLCGGIGLYLLGHAAFRLRMIGEFNAYELGTILAMLVIYALTSSVAAWVVVALAAAAILALCVVEARSAT